MSKLIRQMNQNNIFSTIFLITVFLFGLTSCGDQTSKVRIETEYGDMIVELRDDTPLHKENFLKLVDEGFYDDLLFHRVMQNFMIQGGDPNSKNAPPNSMLGQGGPGYTLPAEFNDAPHIYGALSAARLPDGINPEKESSGSQFFIVQGVPINESNKDQIFAMARNGLTDAQQQAYLEAGRGYPSLDGEYTVFGQVVEGLDVIDKIAAQYVNQAKRPNADIKMKIIRLN